MQYEFLKSSKLSVGSTIVHSTGEYTIRDNLGKGAFGEVYKVTNSSNNTYALKLLHYKTPWELEKAKKEAAMLKSLNHRNIISYVNSFAVEGGHYIIVTEYCAQGSLKDVLYSMGSREGDEGKILKWVHQLLNAVCHLHEAKIIHRDLKPDNILIAADGTLKIGDLGIAADRSQSSEELYGVNPEYNSTLIGTRAFMAPEYFTRGRYKESVDIFAVGLIIYVMVERPEDGIPRLYNRLVCDAIQVGDERIITAEFFYPLFRKSIWKKGSFYPGLRDLILRMLNPNPADRKTPRELLELVVKELLPTFQQDEPLFRSMSWILEQGRERTLDMIQQYKAKYCLA